MKKYIHLLLLFSIQLQSYCQKPAIVNVRCSDSLILSIKGRYHFQQNIINQSVLDSKTHSAEMIKRLNAMHKLLEEAIHQPLGLEAKWKTMTGQYTFAQDTRYKKGIHTYHFSYICFFFYYDCTDYNTKLIGPSGETNTWLTINVNGANPGLGSKGSSLDSMTVNGLPVYQRFPVVEKWKDYDLFRPIGMRNDRSIMIHRNGAEPYLPVSRKQYLDYCIPWLDKFYDQMLQNILAEMPLRSKEEQEAQKNKWLNKIDEDYKNNPAKKEGARKNYLDSYRTDEQWRDEKKDNVMKQKKATLKLYEKELEKTTRDGLLDSPAIIYDWHPLTADIPIFMTEAEGGGMLVTENPAYFRKDLPKYVPQIIWMHWIWDDNTAGNNFRKMLEANFPIEKLQAMIDK